MNANTLLQNKANFLAHLVNIESAKFHYGLYCLGIDIKLLGAGFVANAALTPISSMKPERPCSFFMPFLSLLIQQGNKRALILKLPL
ncbi:hypothetical protein GDO81_002532 [Engystomops pustulosus]|uniref:Uncharacterized protein n=1 Tax=Engystomops pustulosus TaxID=76066 RepID=A0AAV7DM10_ENGPU|nr:hypothetical protein GDO81_002532 [Engystomops pustulosus]